MISRIIKLKIRLFQYFFYSCIVATELVEKGKIVGITFKEKVRLRLHMIMCKRCHIYELESDSLDEHIKHIVEHHSNHLSSEELKKTILDHIEK